VSTKPVTQVPSRIAGNPQSGWTVYSFQTAMEAAAFVQQYPECAMPCWKRFDVVNGELLQTR